MQNLSISRLKICYDLTQALTHLKQTITNLLAAPVQSVYCRIDAFYKFYQQVRLIHCPPGDDAIIRPYQPSANFMRGNIRSDVQGTWTERGEVHAP